MLVSYSSGTVKSSPGYDVLKRLPSFVCLETYTKAGSKVEYTTDLLTSVGSIILMHMDASVVERDLDFVRYMEKINGFFAYETKMETLDNKNTNTLHKRMYSSDSTGPILIR